MAPTEDLVVAFELHSTSGIREALDAGADPRSPIGGKTPIQILVEMYNRSSRFADCLRLMLDAGATLQDPALEAALLDDDDRLRRLVSTSPDTLSRRLSMNCAFTSLRGVSLLHVCAEYNSVNCTRFILEKGVSADVRADIDSDGLGGHTPIFHAVNSNHNYSRRVMEPLVEAGADLGIRLQGLVWGLGFEWETVIFDVTPISYAQCGLYSQFHRPEAYVYGNIAYLYQKKYGHPPPIRNVPNKYLQDHRVWPPRT
jgi:ankyrin repeat protein